MVLLPDREICRQILFFGDDVALCHILIHIDAVGSLRPFPLFLKNPLFHSVHAVVSVSGNTLDGIDKGGGLAVPELFSKFGYCTYKIIAFPVVPVHLVIIHWLNNYSP